MTTQITTRIPDEDVAGLDALVAEGKFATRTDALREAVRRLLHDAEQRRIDAEIAAGYQRVPATDAEDAWAQSAGRELIAEEPW